MARTRWRELVDEVTASRARMTVLSSEFFSDAPAERIDGILQALDPRRTQVVITLRPLCRILPSQWQQYMQNQPSLKYDDALDYEGWLDAILNHPDDSSVTPTFWRRHRHDRLVRDWVAAAGRNGSRSWWSTTLTGAWCCARSRSCWVCGRTPSRCAPSRPTDRSRSPRWRCCERSTAGTSSRDGGLGTTPDSSASGQSATCWPSDQRPTSLACSPLSGLSTRPSGSAPRSWTRCGPPVPGSWAISTGSPTCRSLATSGREPGGRRHPLEVAARFAAGLVDEVGEGPAQVSSADAQGRRHRDPPCARRNRVEHSVRHLARTEQRLARRTAELEAFDDSGPTARQILRELAVRARRRLRTVSRPRRAGREQP